MFFFYISCCSLFIVILANRLSFHNSELSRRQVDFFRRWNKTAENKTQNRSDLIADAAFPLLDDKVRLRRILVLLELGHLLGAFRLLLRIFFLLLPLLLLLFNIMSLLDLSTWTKPLVTPVATKAQALDPRRVPPTVRFPSASCHSSSTLLNGVPLQLATRFHRNSPSLQLHPRPCIPEATFLQWMNSNLRPRLVSAQIDRKMKPAHNCWEMFTSTAFLSASSAALRSANSFSSSARSRFRRSWRRQSQNELNIFQGFQRFKIITMSAGICW